MRHRKDWELQDRRKVPVRDKIVQITFEGGSVTVNVEQKWGHTWSIADRGDFMTFVKLFCTTSNR